MPPLTFKTILNYIHGEPVLVSDQANSTSLTQAIKQFEQSAAAHANGLLGALAKSTLSPADKRHKIKDIKDATGKPLSFFLFTSRYSLVEPVLGLVNIQATDTFDNNMFHFMASFTDPALIKRIQQILKGLMQLGFYGAIRDLAGTNNAIRKTPMEKAVDYDNQAFIRLLDSLS